MSWNLWSLLRHNLAEPPKIISQSRFSSSISSPLWPSISNFTFSHATFFQTELTPYQLSLLPPKKSLLDPSPFLSTHLLHRTLLCPDSPGRTSSFSTLISLLRNYSFRFLNKVAITTRSFILWSTSKDDGKYAEIDGESLTENALPRPFPYLQGFFSRCVKICRKCFTLQKTNDLN